ncbi:DUF2169 family type VI secretion system accessory protein [Acanthopleuribacter pedis]|uniref:DUF2169 domain-containing protein n=1 Tax=Acanthopleuribacter pedis TaxID=442870 RepID=A0A8J7U7I9_9BACT|nr:DUF2169 domain-containing protein [Acanthopleuribacter pedis]MBO1321456.1 DUF2169 domain-containing protein [Acanthopleuribacter pedis]
MKLVNDSPFTCDRLVYGDGSGRDRLLVIVKAVFAVGEDQTLRPLAEQPALRGADTFYDEVGTSSIQWETEMVPAKPATDVVLLGTAQAKDQALVQHLDVSLKIGPLTKRVSVFGDRVWEDHLTGATPGPITPFREMPLIYERAFGGRDESNENQTYWEAERRNPVGVGFRAKHSAQPVAGSPLPNIEDPTALIRHAGDRPPPAGFGFISRDWSPRLDHAGTYDAAWQEQRAPLLPQDFDPRFHNAAHPDLIAPDRLRGDEDVAVHNVLASGLPWKFQLPDVRPKGAVQITGGDEPLDLQLDTVVLDADQQQVTQVWRGELDIHNRLYQVKEIRVETR